MQTKQYIQFLYNRERSQGKETTLGVRVRVRVSLGLGLGLGSGVVFFLQPLFLLVL